MKDAQIAYREAAVRGSSPVQLVIRLYEQIIDDLRHAIRAIEQDQIELRTKKINHAVLVIAHLQSQLDFHGGPEPARQLSAFYDSVRSGLVRAQFHGSKVLLTQQITDLLEVRSAWLQIDGEAKQAAETPVVVGAVALEPELASGSWKA
jgi:flagellar biosynthetic protein FliS